MISGLTIEYVVGNEPAGEDVLERMTVAFERAGGELADFGTHAFPKMVPVFEAELARQFDAEGQGPNAGSWAALSPAYAEEKAKFRAGQYGLDRKVGRAMRAAAADKGWGAFAAQHRAERRNAREDALAQMAAAVFGGGGDPGPILVRTGALRDALTDSSSSHALRDFSAMEFNFGTEGLEYASYHQSGTANMPDRPPFDFSEQLEEDVQRVALEGAREAIDAAGAGEFLSGGGG